MLDKQRSRKLRKPLFKLEVFNHSLWLLVSYQNIGFSVYGLLLFAKEKRVADLFFGLCCFFIGVDIFFYHLLFFPHHPSLVNVSPVLTAIVFLPVPLYHLFLRADNVGLFRFGKTDYLHFAPFFLGTIWISADYLFGLSVFSPSHSAPILCGLLIFQAILYFLKSKSPIRNADSSAEQQYIGNSLSVNAFYLMLIFVVARNFISFSEGHHFSSFYILLLIVLNLIFVFNAFRNRAHTSNEQPESVTIAGGETTSKDKYTTSPIHDDIKKALIESLEKYFAEKKPYLNPKLCVDEVAHELNTNNKYLSQIVNDHYGRNFTSFVNGFRCACVIEYFGMEEYENFSLDGIAESAGFQSRSTFVAAFKKHTGQLPSAYRSELKKKSIEA